MIAIKMKGLQHGRGGYPSARKMAVVAKKHRQNTSIIEIKVTANDMTLSMATGYAQLFF